MRNAPEKIFVLDFGDLMPPTWSRAISEDVKAFRDEFKDIIVKPLYGNGGAAVFRLQPGDNNLASLVELFQQGWREPFMVQQYRPRCAPATSASSSSTARFGGIINRVPAPDEARSNMHVGGTPSRSSSPTATMRSATGSAPNSRRRGLIFTGIDVIGAYLTEINVTSPTGIREIKKFGGADIAVLIWQCIEAKRA